MAGGIYLLEVDAWTGAAVETLRFSTSTFVTRPTDAPANAVYDGRIIDVGSLNRSLFAGGGISGSPSASFGFIEFVNDDGALDAWLDYGFDGRPFTLRYLADSSLTISAATVVARGTVAAIDTSNVLETMKLQIRDALGALEKPLLTQRYGGTTITNGATADGNLDLKDELKPWVFGTVLNISPKAVNPFNLIYQVSGGPVSSIVVYDGGLPLTAKGDSPSLADLTAMVLAPGEYGTCLALGLFRLGGATAFGVTADVIEGATLADRSAARVAGRMLDLIGGFTDRDLASFNAAHAFNPAEVGIFIEDDTTALDLIGQVLNSIGAGLLPSSTGKITLFSFSAPVGGGRELGQRSLLDTGYSMSLESGASGDGSLIPAWSVVINWGKIWQTQASGDLAGRVSTERRALLESQWRKSTAQNLATKTAHLLATEITIDTLLVNKADADAEAARRLALSGRRRDTINFPVDIEEAPEIGQEVTIKMRRFGYAGGKAFLITGRGDDYDKRVVTLELWG